MRRRDFIGAMGGVPLAVAAANSQTTLAAQTAAVADSAVTPAQMAAFDSPPFTEKGDAVKPAPRKGRIKQAVTRGVFNARPAGAPPAAPGGGPQPVAMEFEEMCRQASRLGIKGFDLIQPPDWPMLKKYGLVSTMIYGIGLGGGGGAARGAAPPAGAAGARRRPRLHPRPGSLTRPSTTIS